MAIRWDKLKGGGYPEKCDGCGVKFELEDMVCIEREVNGVFHNKIECYRKYAKMNPDTQYIETCVDEEVSGC